ncbi:MAG: carboxypeptidase regulatory-like domain-containing protein, partial [Acidobacteria bacterium]|nr:carboxypeptidase regulatory-like domain-containing protein [Acidobacteriota bacterium]
MQIPTHCFSKRNPKSGMRRIGITILLCYLVFISSGSLFSQVTTGYISGYVYDPGGNVIAGAQLTATDSLHSEERTVASDENGFYRFTELRPGTWSVSASAPEFETMINTDVRVTVNARARLDFQLPISGMQQSIEVSAPLTPIQTESSDLGMTLDREKIESLPLNRRDFLQLALLTPGVNTGTEESELSTRGGFAMHANGGREEFNNFLLDGIDNNDAYVNGYTLQPSADTIQEFKIETNNYSAEYGRS